MLADGGECLADLGVLGDQETLFWPVASTSTAFRAIERIARDPQGLERLREAHAQARARARQLLGAPERLDTDVDATLLTAHSEKAGAAGNFKHAALVFTRLWPMAIRPARRWAACCAPGTPARTPLTKQQVELREILRQLAHLDRQRLVPQRLRLPRLERQHLIPSRQETHS
jgi:hypothetical protein